MLKIEATCRRCGLTQQTVIERLTPEVRERTLSAPEGWRTVASHLLCPECQKTWEVDYERIFIRWAESELKKQEREVEQDVPHVFNQQGV